MKKLRILLILLTLLLSNICWASSGWIMKPRLGYQVNTGHPLGTKGGLVGFWLSNEGSGNKVFDLSGNSHIVTFGAGATSPSWVGGKFGPCLSFDGGDHASLPASIKNIGKVYSISLWANSSVAASTRHYLMSLYVSGNELRFAWFNNVSGEIGTYTTGDGGSTWMSFGSTPNDGKWHHIVLVSNAGVASMYIDGILLSSQTITDADLGNATTNAIGAIYDASTGWFTGLIDALSIYNRILSASEITLLYREPFCMFKPSWNWELYSTFSASANTYTIGNDGDDYTTHALMNAGEDVEPGDIISFRRGETFREQCDVEDSGTSGNVITYTAHGTGADPIINGADLVTTWSQYLATDIYSASCNWVPNILAEDDTILTFVAWDTDIATTAAAMSASTWTLDTGNDLVYVWASDDADPDTHTMDVGTRQYGINIANNDYITVENLELKYLGINYSAGVYISETGTYNTVKNCTIHGCGMGETAGMGNGILCLGSYNTFKYNTIYECRHNCININAQSSTDEVGNVIEHNTLYDAHHNLIDIKCSTGETADIRDTIVRYNTFYHSGDYVGIEGNSNGIFVRGISADSTTVTNTKIYYNIFYNIEEDSIRTNEEADTLYIYNNVFYNSGYHHIMFAHTGDVGEDFTAEIINNIGHTVSEYGVIRIDDSTNKIVNYNCWYDSSFAANVDGTGYTVWATYQSGTGFDAASFFADPIFVDAANENFHLAAGSPCINTGVDVGLSVDHEGNSVGDPPEIGAYEKIVAILIILLFQ